MSNSNMYIIATSLANFSMGQMTHGNKRSQEKEIKMESGREIFESNTPHATAHNPRTSIALPPPAICSSSLQSRKPPPILRDCAPASGLVENDLHLCINDELPSRALGIPISAVVPDVVDGAGDVVAVEIAPVTTADGDVAALIADQLRAVRAEWVGVEARRELVEAHHHVVNLRERRRSLAGLADQADPIEPPADHPRNVVVGYRASRGRGDHRQIVCEHGAAEEEGGEQHRGVQWCRGDVLSVEVIGHRERRPWGVGSVVFELRRGTSMMGFKFLRFWLIASLSGSRTHR